MEKIYLVIGFVLVWVSFIVLLLAVGSRLFVGVAKKYNLHKKLSKNGKLTWLTSINSLKYKKYTKIGFYNLGSKVKNNSNVINLLLKILGYKEYTMFTKEFKDTPCKIITKDSIKENSVFTAYRILHLNNEIIIFGYQNK